MDQPLTAYQLRTGGQPVYAPNPYRVQSSEWWIYRLNQRLDGRLSTLRTLDNYYTGSNDTFKLASLAAVQSGIATLFRGINANLAKQVADATRQRLEVFGFRTGSQEDDDRFWRVWQANEMDAEADAAHKEALIMRGCPIVVEPPMPGRGDLPIITPQDPRNCVVEYAAGDRRVARAALKRWLDDDNRMQMTLYLPDRIERWADRTPGGIERFVSGLFGTTPLAYEPRQIDRTSGFSQRNPLDEVPVVLMPNMGRISGGRTESEFEAVLPLIDLYNKTLLDMATTGEFGAFPQRYGIGVDVEEAEQALTDEAVAAVAQQQPLARMQAAVDAMITTPSPDAQFGQFPAADLGNYVKALDQIRANIGTITFTPYHLLLNMPSSTPATGESLRASEVGLVGKVRSDHHREKGRAWRTVSRLCFRLMGDNEQAARARPIAVVWRNPETLSEAQHMDALSKAQGLGVPQVALWEAIPTSPAEIKRWLELKAAEPPPAPIVVAPPAQPPAPAAPPVPAGPPAPTA